MKKVVSDMEKMNKDRRRAEEEYLESQQQKLEVLRIKEDGIGNVDDLLTYIVEVIEDVKKSEDIARMANNGIIYSEAIGIRREFAKLLELVTKDGTAIPMEEVDGTEEKFRAENSGEEAYQ
jgi:hypothetical protein